MKAFYKKLTFWLKNFFGFSQTEINGLVILLVLSVGLLFLPMSLRKIAKSSRPDISKSDKHLLDSLMVVLEKTDQSVPANKETDAAVGDESLEKKKERVIDYQPFDPNDVSVEYWENLGVSERIANRIQNYLSHGGSFKVKKDLMKIYGFDENVFEKLYDYILLPEQLASIKNVIGEEKRLNTRPKKGVKSKQQNYYRVDLNSAEAQDFLQFKGIGAKLSKRIVDFRANLGGFHEKSQLYNVYGVDSSVVNLILENSSLSEENQEKLNINTIAMDSLRKHPYFSYRLAKIIVNYRELHGPYQSLEDLKEIHVVDNQLYDKIEPYLKLE